MKTDARQDTSAKKLVIAPHVLFTALLLVVYGVAYRSGIADAVTAWITDDGYSHGPVIVTVFVYIVFMRRQLLIRDGRSWMGALIIAGATLVYAAADLIHLQLLVYAAMPVALLGIAICAFGLSGLRVLTGPILYLYLALPVWGALTPILQSITAAVAGALVAASGIPANLVGSFVIIPSGTFEIAEGCAGTRFVVAAMALGGLGALLLRNGLGRSVLLIIGAAVLAVIGNWMRVYSLIVIGHMTDMRHTFIVDGHAGYSWMLFCIFMIPVVWVCRKALLDSRCATVAERKAVRDIPEFRRVDILLASLAAIFMIVPVGYTGRLSASARSGAAVESIAWPARVGDWSFTDREAGWKPYFEGADLLETATYVRSNLLANVYVVSYAYQEQGKEVDYYANRVYPEGLRAISSSLMQTTVGPFRLIGMTSYDGKPSLAAFRFRVGDSNAVSKLGLKMITVRYALEGELSAGAEGIWLNCLSECEAVPGDLKDLLEGLFGG